MDQVNKTINNFFENFEKAINSFDVSAISLLYADTFMFGSSRGVQSVKKEDFLNVLPKRQGFFREVGLKTTRFVSLEENKLDDNYQIAKVIWSMRYENKAGQTIDDKTSATYILLSQNNSLQIVMQIDHQDLSERVKELALL